MSDTKLFKCAYPFMTHANASATDITLKYPTARAFMKFGMPYASVNEGDETDRRTEFRINAKIMGKFISDMSGLDELEIEEIDARDYVRLMWTVVGMLNETPQTTTT